jgi:PhnB protein
MHVQPYLFFDGRAEEAIEFYRSALGAEVQRRCVSRTA